MLYDVCANLSTMVYYICVSRSSTYHPASIPINNISPRQHHGVPGKSISIAVGRVSVLQLEEYQYCSWKSISGDLLLTPPAPRRASGRVSVLQLEEYQYCSSKSISGDLVLTPSAPRRAGGDALHRRAALPQVRRHVCRCGKRAMRQPKEL